MATTLMALRRGAHESNPVVIAAMRLFGRVAGLSLAKVAGLGLTALLWGMGAQTVLWTVAALYLWVVSHNLAVWRRRGRLARQLSNRPAR